MDRYSIIQRQVFGITVNDEIDRCGREQCMCDEDVVNKKQRVKGGGLFHLSLIVVMAFVVAATLRESTTFENILVAKTVPVISCSAGSNKSNDRLPGKNNRNTCAHQQASLSETNNSKRKTLKTHNC